MKEYPLLHTKLHIPQPRPATIHRPRLFERLNEGLHRKLTLVSAPAGYGKTTLISDWAAGCGRSVAWFSVSGHDNDLAQFLSYFITALQTIEKQIGNRSLNLLQSQQSPPTELILTYLLNEIHLLPQPCVLVLEDLHAIHSASILAAIHYMLDNLPPQLHLVIITRQDASLDVAQLRVRDQLTELRDADLRFTAHEAAAFLRAMGLELSADDIALLEERTEGWAAGLQLAALSMRGSADHAAFIRSFTGSHPHVMEYLLEQVVQKQPEHMQTFLMRTSILDRMCGSLCDALMDGDVEAGMPSGDELLLQLEHANLFIVALDREQRWYRYHHLFAELLRQRLQRRSASGAGLGVAELHIRASEWYEREGHDAEAFQHAAAAYDIERAERLVEGRGMPLYLRGLMMPVQHWLESLDRSVLDERPSLWVAYAWTLTMSGQPVSHVEDKLRSAESVLQRREPDEQTRDLAGRIAVVQAMLAIPLNQVDVMMRKSRQALALLHSSNLPIRTSATWTLGLACQLQGDYAAASQAYHEAIAASAATGNRMITIAATICLGQVQEAENRLELAAETYRSVLQSAGDPPPPNTCEAYLGLARIHYQWDNLGEAEQYARLSAQLATHIQTIDTPAVCYVLLASVRLAQGDLTGAAAMLDHAEQFLRRRQQPGYATSAIMEVRVLLQLERGDLEAAARMAVRDEPSVSRVRVLLTQGDAAAAIAMLDKLMEQVQNHEMPKLRLLLAIAYDAQGQQDEALRIVEEVFAYGAAGGCIRLFADEGKPMRSLLAEAAARGIMPDYAGKLMLAFRRQDQPSAARKPAWIEPLSKRELLVLQLIAQGCSNREIGERLFLAEDTVKGYNRRIFGKLQVQRRTEAVARAREWGFI